MREPRAQAQAPESEGLDRRGGEVARDTPGEVWALDFPLETITDDRLLKLPDIVDEHTREALAILAGRRIDADELVATLDG